MTKHQLYKMPSLSDAFKSVPVDCKEPDISSMQEVPETYLWPQDDDPPVEERVKCFGKSSAGIPVIDLMNVNWQEYNEQAGELEEGVIRQISAACNDCAVFQIVNHGVPQLLLEKAEMQGRRLFSLPLDQKLRARRAPDGVTGYGMARISTFFDKLLWSEGFTLVGSPSEHAKKIWPDDYQEFCEVMEEYEHAMKQLAMQLMSLIVKSLGLCTKDFRWCDYNYGFDEMCGALQMNYYPSCPQPTQTMGLAAHTDSTMITILYQGSVDGLQIHQDGRWMVVPAVPNAFVVNVGDLLQVLSNGRYKSVLHRAVVNESRHRLSLAYLWGPPPAAMVEPASQLVDSQHPRLYKSFTWNEYLIARAKYFNKALQLFENEVQES